MNRFSLYILAFLTLHSVTACYRPKLDDTVAGVHHIDIVGESSFNVSYEGDIISAAIDANCNWIVSKTGEGGEDISWIKTDISTGKGPVSFKIKVLRNNTAFPRTGSINIYSEQVSAFVDIIQEANPDPDSEPGVFKGYNIPLYQMFTPGGVAIKSNSIYFANGLVIEKTGDSAGISLLPDGILPGAALNEGSGESLIFKMPFNYEVKGDLRFMYGAHGEEINAASAFQWSSDKGRTWNEVSRFEPVVADSPFKSAWLTIPDEKSVPKEGSLWIKMSPGASSLSLLGGIALDRASASPSSLPAEDMESVVVSEGFDETVSVNASYIAFDGYMKSAVGGYTEGGADVGAYSPANASIAGVHCFARPGFIQIGYSDEAQAKRCGFNGALTIRAGERLEAMGLDGTTNLIVKMKAATLTNAFGVKSDARLVVKVGDKAVAGVDNLPADKFESYQFIIPDADKNTVLTITSKPHESKAGEGEAATAEASADYRFFIDDLLIEKTQQQPKLELTFDFSQNPGGWPETNKRKAAVEKYLFNLNGTDYEFIMAPPKDAIANGSQNESYYNTGSNHLTITNKRYLGLPAIGGYKLTKVSCVHSSDDGSRNVGITTIADVSSTATQSYASGGDIQTFLKKGETYTFNLSETAAGSVYYIYCRTVGVGISSITLTYEQ